MKRLTHISKADTICIYVQGWIGSVETKLSQEVFSFLVSQNIDYWAFDFKGHDIHDPYLSTLTEMVDTLQSEVSLISSLYPEKKIILVGHSQGCVVIYRYLTKNHLTTPALFITPAFDIQKIILESRLTQAERSTLRSQPITKEFRKDIFKIITPQWLLDYESQEYSAKLSENSTYHAVFGNDDPIVTYDVNKEIFDFISHQSPSVLIEGDHVFSQNLKELFTVFDEFISHVE